MNIFMSPLHCGHWTRSLREGGMASSPSQALHLKCIIGVMRPLVVILLLARPSADARSAQAETARIRRHLSMVEAALRGSNRSTLTPAQRTAARSERVHQARKRPLGLFLVVKRQLNISEAVFDAGEFAERPLEGAKRPKPYRETGDTPEMRHAPSA